MNIVMVLIDSLTRNALSAYHPSDIDTPNFDKFAEKSVRFDNHIAGSLPCMPARREIFSGRKEMMWRPWGPLEPFDARLPKLLEAQGYRTAMVTDHYHYWEEAANGYLQGFESTHLIRGHELDNWRPLINMDRSLPKWVENIEKWRPGFGKRYYSNVRDFESEDDYFPAKVFSGAIEWLQENRDDQPFYLHVESFDVHEPFDAPEPYASRYGDGKLRDEYTLWPPYQDPDMLAQFNETTTEEELDFIRSQYAAKVTMADKWFGKFITSLEDQGLMENTMVILTTDHGHDLGERRVFGKQYPHWDSHAHIPLIIYHPQYSAGATSSLTATVDLHATVLEAARSSHRPPHGQSLLPMLVDKEHRVHDGLLYGTFGQGVCCTDGIWTVFKSPNESNTPLYAYSSMILDSLTVDTVKDPESCGHFIGGVPLSQWKIPVTVRPLSTTDYLFNRVIDPEQRRNLWETEEAQRTRMLALLQQLLESEGCPEEQYQRLGLGG